MKIPGGRVTGRVVSAGLTGGLSARAKIELEGTDAATVKEMFLTERADRFFPGAKTWMQQRTRQGGQSFLENPMFPVPLMFTTINPTEGNNAKGEFVGLLNGEAPLHIYDKGGKTYIEEVGTQVHFLTPMDTPMWKGVEKSFAESNFTPFKAMGMFARGMRKASNAVMGAPLAMVHAALVSRDNAQTIARTLTDMQRRG